MFATLTLDTLNLLGSTSHGAGGVTPAKLFTLLAFGLWVGHCLIAKDSRLFGVLGSNLTNYFVWAFLLASILSNVNAAEYVPGLKTISPWGVVIRRMTMILLFLTVIAIVRRRGTMTFVMLAYLIGGLATCYAGLYELYTGKLFLGMTLGDRDELMTASSGGVRIQGLEVDPDVQATFLLFGVAMLPYVWHRASGALPKLGVLFLGAVYAVNIIAVGSKAGWIGLAAMLPLYLLLSNDPRKWRDSAIGAACGLVILGILVTKADIVSLDKLVAKTDAHVNTIRAGFIRMQWGIVQDHPIIGAGCGAFANEYQRYFRRAFWAVPSDFESPSLNGYMEVWGENGTTGLIALLMVFATALGETWTGWRKSVDPGTKMLGASLLILFVLVVWVNGVYPVLDSKYVWLSFGLMVAYGNIVRAEVGHTRPAPVALCRPGFGKGAVPFL